MEGRLKNLTVKDASHLQCTFAFNVIGSLLNTQSAL